MSSVDPKVERRRRAGGDTIYILTLVALAMSLGHHVDHVLRGNAIGWPLTSEVNSFTMSLGIYPLIGAGLWLYSRRYVGPGFWVFLSGGGAAFVSAVHFGPFAAEPPHYIHGGYENPLLGWLAFAWLAAFVSLLFVTAVYEARVWFNHRRAAAEGAGTGVADA